MMNLKRQFPNIFLSLEIKYELVVDVWTGEPKSHLSWALVFSYLLHMKNQNTFFFENMAEK